MENEYVTKLKTVVSAYGEGGELTRMMEEKKATYSSFIQSRDKLLEDYDFRLRETSERGVVIKGLKELVANLKTAKVETVRVHSFTIGELDYTAIYTDEQISIVYGVI